MSAVRRGPEAAVAVPLAQAALCLDCEQVFRFTRPVGAALLPAAGEELCPSCGGRAWVLLERFFLGRDRRLVRHEDVIHHAGNGLTPARVRAERLAQEIDRLVNLNLTRNPFFHRHMEAHARAVVEAIDQTLERLRQLGEVKEDKTHAAQDR